MNDDQKICWIISREEWGAQPPAGPLDLVELPHSIFYHVYAKGPWSPNEEDCKRRVREIQEQHIEQGYPDIQYNFLVGADGNIYEGVGWDKRVVDFDRRSLDEYGKCILAYIGRPQEPRYMRRMMRGQDRLCELAIKKKYLKLGNKFGFRVGPAI